MPEYYLNPFKRQFNFKTTSKVAALINILMMSSSLVQNLLKMPPHPIEPREFNVYDTTTIITQ